ncbi:MAG: reverse transcriptase domain-containing protein, partial [Kangiellaceae bacterium]|nr:reverse transcriptase domain-containing protein [Kangiellaceae bacterium]
MAAAATCLSLYVHGEDIEEYLEMVQCYFDANSTEDNKRVSTLLAYIGPATYKIIRGLTAPDKPVTKKFAALCKLLVDHFAPKPSVCMRCFRFNSRNRTKGESVSDFMADLRRLAQDCEYGNQLNDMLRDRLVCGIANVQIQKRLLTEKDLTLTKAVKISQAAEMASRNAEELKPNVLSHPTGPQVNFKSAIKPKTKPMKSKLKQEATNYNTGSRRSWYRCGSKEHLANKCNFKNVQCSYCKKVGHLQKVCLSKKSINYTEEEVYDPLLGHIDTGGGTNAWHIVLTLNGESIKFLVDTGASVTVMPNSQFAARFPKRCLEKSELKISTYTGEKIKVVGNISVQVSKDANLEAQPLLLHVVEGNGPPLLGRDWIAALDIKFQILAMQMPDVNHVTSEFKLLFDVSEKGKMKGFKAVLKAKGDATPVFQKARPVPFALKDRVREELENLENQGIIQKVSHSDWASPIVPVVKSSGKIRICGDYKQVNKAIYTDPYPLPLIDDILANLAGCKYFFKLDLSQAYHQLELDEESRKFTTINTTNGLYVYLRLPFGVSPAVGIFQRCMENILRGMSGVFAFLDDILITGRTLEEHEQNLRKVFSILEENGLRLQKEKCALLVDDLQYLGYRLTAEGLRPTQDKIRAIEEAPKPHSVAELRSVIGLLNYYARFIPNMADVMNPLYKLLKNDSKWIWTDAHDRALETVKNHIASEPILAHYDQKSEIVLTCDASPVGVGAV